MRDGFEQDKLLDGRFLTVSPLNHGSFGMVFAAKDTLTGADVAIKCITKAEAVKDTASCPAAIATDERSEELDIHSHLPEHPNIVNLVHHFETEAHQYMVLELCGNGDLYEAIRTGRGPLETEHVRDFMLQLVDAIDHLHANGVFHRDIKPENIFLTSSGTMKLGDFGLATAELWSTEFAVGSDRYMAPEQYDASVYGYGYSPASADVWAIGVVLLNVLFQRNPFATPTTKDPLFDDFARNRHSLFDVFPNMSQDTFDVIRQCMTLDPGNRSLGGVREALKAVVSFTTDEETLDDFCNEQNDLVPVSTAARKPLRTPSITSPTMNSDSFPFSAATEKTPQKTTRQLSTIRDTEPDLFPGSIKNEWRYADPDEVSLSSNLDSGLGSMSYKSTKSTKSAISFLPGTNFVGSLPISFARPKAITKLTSPYGAKGSGFSKSWSDLWDEDEELGLQGRSSFDAGAEIDRINRASALTPISEDDRGSATPRPILAETDANVRSSSPLRKLIEHDRANEESSKQRSSSILDKWAALGNFRRAKQEPSSGSQTPVPQKSKYSEAFSFSNFATFGSGKKTKPVSQDKSTDSVVAWREGSPTRLRSTSNNKSQVWDRKQSPPQPPVPAVAETWKLDNNWRQHKSPAPVKTISTSIAPSGHHKSDKPFFDSNSDDDDTGDLEWVVGGWQDFQI